MEEYIGIVKLFAGNFAPRGWALCNGQILSIAQNSALFAILGTTYGGNGQTTFALPNLQGAVALGAGNGNGGSYVLGQVAGTPSVSLLTSNLPAHVHTGPGKISVSATNATDSTPVAGSSIGIPGSIVSRVFTPTLGYATATPSVDLISNVTTGATGNNQPVSIMQPYLAMNYIICLEGIFPSRN
ncbi:microcystin-dependent protein [Flavobacterium chryseum]|uniref:phage tail protein n=1 Tax=Flavobacterium sp. P3160 TaxID=2512113 RepID=UPI00105CDD32|nr:tail fiber protein [Flavobacterium sp. P3160]TDO73282.1 microcystin-dependent protein [Flavobacterium sp. P3160]